MTLWFKFLNEFFKFKKKLGLSVFGEPSITLRRVIHPIHPSIHTLFKGWMEPFWGDGFTLAQILLKYINFQIKLLPLDNPIIYCDRDDVDIATLLGNLYTWAILD